MLAAAVLVAAPAWHPFSRGWILCMGSAMDRQAPPPSRASASHELDPVLHAVASGSRPALRDLYGRTSPKLYGICLRLLGDETEAEEVLQDVYLTVWNNAGRFDPAKASPITWLAIVARNKAIDRLRRRRMASASIDSASEVADDRPSAFDVLQRVEDEERLHGCLDELDEQPRNMIRAAFLDGATYPELAEREGVPLGTMKSWIRRALLRLRGCLQQ